MADSLHILARLAHLQAERAADDLEKAADAETARYNKSEQLASSIEKKDADTKQAIIDKIGREAPSEPDPDGPDLDFGAGAVLDAEPEHAVAEPTAAPGVSVEPAPAGPVPVPYPNTLDAEPEHAVAAQVALPEPPEPVEPAEPVVTPTFEDALSDVEDNQSTVQFDIDSGA